MSAAVILAQVPFAAFMSPASIRAAGGRHLT